MAKKKGRTKGKTLKIFLIISITFFTLSGLGLIVASPYLSDVNEYRNTALQIAASSSRTDFRSTETSIIYDVYGKEITSISGAVELYYLESSEIPDLVKRAFVLTEDRKFYSHNGIDLFAIARSTIANLRSSTIAQGASTITQQLARNIYLTQDVTWERKITEMFLALELEKRYTKEQILEYYINNIYYANGYYGIEAAAEGYFSASVNDLTISELAFLVGIPNNPSRYDPVNNMERALERRNHILGLLHDYGYINDMDYDHALTEDIVLVRNKKTKNDYVETYVFYCATRALMEMNGFEFRYQFENEADESAYNDAYDYYYSQYQRTLFTDGYRIYTAIDVEKQELLQGYVNEVLSSYTDTNEEGIYKMQAAAVCVDNTTGYVTAIVGGRDQNFPGYTLNRAYQSYRQSGSAIKPLNVYAPFLQLGHNPDYLIDDSPMENGPENSEDRYLGETTLQEALSWSSNVAAWKIYEEITPQYGMSFLRKLNFKRLGTDDDYMATCLGGFTYGVSSVEMAGGFAALANDGKYREPTAVMRITDPKGRVLVDNTLREIEIYDSNAARMVNKILQYGVENALAKNAELDNAIVAAKTGTTTDNKDGWTVGYSMYYTTAVWVGCDIPESVESLSGGTYPMAIWKEFMHDIHDGLELKEFPDYERYEENEDSENEEMEETQSSDGMNIYSPDEDAAINGGDMDGEPAGDIDGTIQGDAEAPNITGDQTVPITGGDRPASSVGGDAEAATTGGDRDAVLSGDTDGEISGEDADAPTFGDSDAGNP